MNDVHSDAFVFFGATGDLAKRLVLPAFGSFTGGLNVLDPALALLFPAGFAAVVFALFAAAFRNEAVTYAHARSTPS